MTLLLDTSLWIDFTRARSSTALKQFIVLLEAQFATLPTLPTPADLWPKAIASVSELRLKRLRSPA
jgi:hypothetical protein